MSAVPGPVYLREFESPKIREEITSDWGKMRYSQQQSATLEVERWNFETLG
jgi:hypothetical protein